MKSTLEKVSDVYERKFFGVGVGTASTCNQTDHGLVMKVLS